MTKLIKEAKRFQELAGINEVKIQPQVFLPMTTQEEDEDGDTYTIFNWDNIFKNIRLYKNIIAKKLNINDKDTLRKVLYMYVNDGLVEMEHQGEGYLYDDIDFDGFLEDISLSTDMNDLNSFVEDGIYTMKDIFGN